jgi:hypothetical protein
MRRRSVATLLAILLGLPAGASAEDIFDTLASLDKDAYVHFSAGVLVSHASYPLLKHWLRDRKKAMWYSLVLTAALSVAKEAYDRDKTGFNGEDLAAGILGGCTILVVAFD